MHTIISYHPLTAPDVSCSWPSLAVRSFSSAELGAFLITDRPGLYPYRHRHHTSPRLKHNFPSNELPHEELYTVEGEARIGVQVGGIDTCMFVSFIFPLLAKEVLYLES